MGGGEGGVRIRRVRGRVVIEKCDGNSQRECHGDDAVNNTLSETAPYSRKSTQARAVNIFPCVAQRSGSVH